MRAGANPKPAPEITLTVSGEDAMNRLGQDIAMALQPRDCLGLYGDLGAGKSTLARAIIRHLANNLELEVPSPTFTLEQIYETNPPIHHYDFYRLGDASEVFELGLDEALEGGVAIIEWPQKAAGQLPTNLAKLQIDIETGNTREISISGPAEFLDRIGRSLNIREFLNDNWGDDVERRTLTGDASTRAYEHAILGGQTRLLMNAPRQPDGPPVRDGKPYSQIAHLAENVSAFVGIDLLLEGAGFYAPKIYAQNLEGGLLLTEFMGTEGVLDDAGKPIKERYLAAATLLVDVHLRAWPNLVQISEDASHNIPNYDQTAMMIEVELLTDWFAPSTRGEKLDDSDLSRFTEIWQALIENLQQSEQSLVLRDYHSPNLIWRAGASGHDRLGLIDFQDAVTGPAAYDLASLAQDARVDISPELEEAIITHYIKLRTKADPNFDAEELRTNYAIAAALRVSKILGIFIRLHERDMKPTYLKHMPRMRGYLERCFKNHALADYQNWFEEVLDGK